MSYIYIDREDEMEELCTKVLDNTNTVYTDIETTGLDWSKDKILLFQILIDSNIYIIDVRKLGYELLKKFASCLNISKRICVFHNTKFDLKFIWWNTGVLLENVNDTMVTELIINAGRSVKKYYSLKDLAEKYAGIYMEKESRNEFIDFPDDKPFTETMLLYSANDVKVLEPIVEAQLEEIYKTYQDKIYRLENSVLPVAAKMELNGIGLDIPRWLEVEKRAIRRRERFLKILKGRIIKIALSLKVSNGLELAKKIKIPVKTKKLTQYLEDIKDTSIMGGWLDENFNVKSPLQMKEALNLAGVPVKDTNEKTLSDYADNKVVRVLLKIREVNKQIDSYGSNMLEHINPITGKIHTEYSTIGTATGRFSSQKPNLQQVPTHGGYRECFIPDEGYYFLNIDYSQQEYRLAGAISRDPVIIDAYKNGSDMHTATGKIIFKRDEITKDERSKGKTVNFAILYGSTEFGLKRNLNISVDEAVRIIKDFWDGYKNLSAFMKKAGEKILEFGFSSTPMGRRRYNIDKPLYGDSKTFTKWKERVLREGRNHIIQGGGADILKLAMVRIHNENPYGDKLQLLLQIHDELLAQVHGSIKEEAGLFMKRIMEEEEQKFLGQIPAKVEGFDEFKDRWSK